MKKKIISGILAAAMAAACLAGCGGTQESSSGTSQTESVTSESSAAESSAAESTIESTAESTSPESAESMAESEPEELVLASERATQYGSVIGSVTDGVEVYYGVPYGADTAGENRWAAPKAPAAWTEVKDVSAKEDAAIQLSGEEVTGTTDCLNLDVYTTPEAEKCPVIVYIHGGNNQTGNSFEIPGFDLVKNDGIVYVSLNYRLGLLGFNCLPALIDEENPTGNFTLLDLAMALQWVRDNIANFGGDPANVTVSGFSAGGRDVMAMLLSQQFDGLFDKAIAYSGGMTVADVDASQKKIAEALAPLAVEDGMAADEAAAVEWLLTDNPEIKDYLCTVTEDRLVPLMSNAGIRMSVFPHLYGDDVMIPANGFESDLYVNDVPILMLTGSSEFTFFGLFDPYFGSIEDEAEKNAAMVFTDTYGSDLYRVFNTQLSAEKMAEFYNSDMYLCQVNYGGQDSASLIPMFGSFHGIFVPMISGINGYSELYDFSADGYQDMAGYFNKYLTNFVKTGNPNGEGLEVEWPAWKAGNKLTLVLDADETKAQLEVKDVFKTNEEIIAACEADETISEEHKTYIIQNIMNGRWFSADLDAHFNTPSLW
ncbi:MAG: carboxylesterase family protein [Lachnospiraceae bacterium]|nr:carboxylesterase family protein [Lachnospiraceae bacterium]